MSRLTKYIIDEYIARDFSYDNLEKMSDEDFEAFDEIVQKLGRYEDMEEQGELINAAWIPCNVKMPTNEFLYYITTIKDIRNGNIYIAKKSIEKTEDGVSVWVGDCWYQKVLAWMPIPEPYEEPKEEDNE